MTRIQELFAEMDALRKYYRPIPFMELGAEIDAHPEIWERWVHIQVELELEGELRCAEAIAVNAPSVEARRVDEAVKAMVAALKYYERHKEDMDAASAAGKFHHGFALYNEADDRLNQIAAERMTPEQAASVYTPPTQEWVDVLAFEKAMTLLGAHAPGRFDA